MVFIGAGLAVVSIGVGVAGSSASAADSRQAGANAATVDNETAAYNNQADISQAQQLDENEQQNVITERQDNSVYLSRQAASYASSGVLATTGSALGAQIVTAGRLEQQVQQKYVNTQQQEEELYSQGLEGVYYGSAQAQADTATGNSQANLALIDGGAAAAGQAFKAVESGTFSFGGGGGGNDNEAGIPEDQ